MAGGWLKCNCATAIINTDFWWMADQSAFVNSTNGSLVVYSAYDVNASFNNRDSSEPVYSDYDIFSSNGNPLSKVHNNSGTLLQDPLTVELTPGKYSVLAFANGYVRKVLVPVIIEAGRITIIHLEGVVSGRMNQSLTRPMRSVCQMV